MDDDRVDQVVETAKDELEVVFTDAASFEKRLEAERDPFSVEARATRLAQTKNRYKFNCRTSVLSGPDGRAPLWTVHMPDDDGRYHLRMMSPEEIVLRGLDEHYVMTCTANAEVWLILKDKAA